MTLSAAPAEQPRSFANNVWETIVLGLPLIAAQLVQTAINVTNSVLLGRLGPDELAASILGWQFFYVIWMFGCGFGFAVMPLVAGAVGTRDPHEARSFLTAGLWVCLAYAAVFMPVLSSSERIFLALGQQAHIAELAARYVGTLQWSLFPQLAIIVFRSYLGALGRPGIIVLALAAGCLLNVALCVELIFGVVLGLRLGIAGAGLATFLSTSCVALFLAGHISSCRALRAQKVFEKALWPKAGSLAQVARIGWPIGIAIVSEVALFTATSFMMGWVGVTELAAHGIALQLSSLAFMIPLGLSAAVTIRVGIAHGRADRTATVSAAKAGLTVGLAIACLTATAFLVFPTRLIAIFLAPEGPGATAVVPIAIVYLSIAGLYQIADTVQVLSNGSLRGLKDTRIPMLIAVASYWGVGVPLGYWLAFKQGWGGVGIWWGLAIGLSCSATFMTTRFIWKLRAK